MYIEETCHLCYEQRRKYPIPFPTMLLNEFANLLGTCSLRSIAYCTMYVVRFRGNQPHALTKLCWPSQGVKWISGRASDTWLS